MIRIRRAGEDDFEAIWSIFRRVVQSADTYPYPPDTDRDQARALWVAPPNRAYVALDGGEVVGTYYLRPNQPGQGAHVANAGFMVDPEVQGRGVGRAMGTHALEEARRAGFLSMQFNMVVGTNQRAVALWRDLGFSIIGTVPAAFKHPEHGLVDAHIMYRKLQEPDP